jgi:hypothetical protein
MFRFKQLFGGRLWARRHAPQRTEARVKCAVLNRMTQLGMPARQTHYNPCKKAGLG